MTPNEETPMTTTKPAQPTIAELAQWPTTEEAVTVANMHRALLVWAKVYECRLVNLDDKAPLYAAATAAFTTAGILLDALDDFDADVALDHARRIWRGSDDGETVAEALIEALDSIDRELAEAVVVAYEEATKGGAA